MRMLRFLTLVAVVAATPLVHAQEAEQQKLLARRAAIADAYRKLAEAVYGIQLNSTTLVKDFVTESDEIQGEVNAMVRGVRLGEARWYSDNSCDIPAEVTVAKVVQTLREAHSRHYRGDRVQATDFESLSERIEKRVIKVVGSGAPRTDLPPGVDEDEIVSEVGGPQPDPFIPDIWRQVGPQGRLMARRAAELDALRMLAEQIKGVQLNSRTYVRDFVTESDEILTELNTSLRGAETVKEFYHANELICEVTKRIPTEQVITTIKQLHTRHYRGDSVRGADIEQVSQRIVKRDFEATGMGVPPKRVRARAQTVAVSMPDWVSAPVRATGEATDPDFSSAQGRLKARRAAELDAKRRLAEQIAGLTIRSDTYVRDFVTEYDEIRSELDNVLLVNSTIVDEEFTTETARVTVMIPGTYVWSVISEWTVRLERRG